MTSLVNNQTPHYTVTDDPPPSPLTLPLPHLTPLGGKGWGEGVRLRLGKVKGVDEGQFGNKYDNNNNNNNNNDKNNDKDDNVNDNVIYFCFVMMNLHFYFYCWYC